LVLVGLYKHLLPQMEPPVAIRLLDHSPQDMAAGQEIVLVAVAVVVVLLPLVNTIRGLLEETAEILMVEQVGQVVVRQPLVEYQ
jgi:hypothetical protein